MELYNFTLTLSGVRMDTEGLQMRRIPTVAMTRLSATPGLRISQLAFCEPSADVQQMHIKTTTLRSDAYKFMQSGVRSLITPDQVGFGLMVVHP